MEKAREPKEKGQEQPKYVETYWRVVFSAKSNPNDTDDVHLVHNGETLLVQRERKVVVPARFLEVADHAVYPHFRQVPNEPRKIISWIKTYPHTKIEQATEEEYLRQKAMGTKKLKQDIKKYGFDVIPEDHEDFTDEE